MNRNFLVAILLSVAFVGYFHEFIFLGQDAHVRVQDNLDSDVNYRHLLVKENAIFAGPHAEIRPIMNGLPRVCLPSGLNIMVWLYWLFGTFGGFVASEFLAHALAYIGIYLLLKNHFLKEDKDFWLRHLAALFFAAMPFFSVTGGAVALQPLLLNAFLNIRNSGKIRWKDIIPIVLFPLYSSIVWVGMFVLIFLGMFAVYHLITAGMKRSLAFFAALTLLTVLSVVADYQLFMAFLNPKAFFVSHRVNFVAPLEYNYKGVLLMGAYNAMTGIYHSANYAGIFFFLPPLVVIVNKIVKREPLFKDKMLFFLLGILVFLGLLTTVWYWEKLGFLYGRGSLLTQINFSRFHYLLPLTGFVLLAYSYMKVQAKWGKYLIIAMLVVGAGWHYKLYYDFHHCTPSKYSDEHIFSNISFNEYYSVDLFEKIKNDCDSRVGHADYNVIGFGVPPAVLQHNTFNTVDSYQNLYPLSYEQAFMKIEEKELDKCPALKGSNLFKIHSLCYLYSCEVYAQPEAEATGKITTVNELLLDPDAIQKLKGRFIISRYKVLDFGSDRIKEVAYYENAASRVYRKIYLYEVL